MSKTSFASTLDHLADSSALFKLADLNGLSNARRADTQLFAERWPGIAVERRREIVRGMGELSEDNFEVEFTPLYRVAMHDADPQVRAAAIDNLWESEDTALIEPYLKFMTQDEASEVRGAAAKALGKYMLLAEMEELDEEQAASVRQALLTTSRNPVEDLEVRRRAIESLGYLSDDEIRAVIEDAYNAPSEKLQASALSAMGRSLDQYWSGTILMELSNTNPEVRLEAVRASGELELKRAVPALVDLLEDPNRPVLLETIHALGQIGGPVARQALEMMAESEDEEVVEWAEDALAELEFSSGEDWLVYDFNARQADDAEPGEPGADDDELDLDEAFRTLWQRRDNEFDD